MSATHEQFLRDKDLSHSWAQIAHGDLFQQVKIFAQSEMCEVGCSTDELLGAMRLLHILETIGDRHPDTFQFPASGLVHNVEAVAKERREKKTKEPKPS